MRPQDEPGNVDDVDDNPIEDDDSDMARALALSAEQAEKGEVTSPFPEVACVPDLSAAGITWDWDCGWGCLDECMFVSADESLE